MCARLLSVIGVRGIGIGGLALLVMVGCAVEEEGPGDEPPWLTFRQHRSPDPTIMWLYVERDGTYLSAVASGRMPSDEAMESCVPPPASTEEASGCVYLGPRRVGDVSDDDWATLELLISDDRWAIYESEPESARPATDGSDPEWSSFGPGFGGPPSEVTFVRERVAHAETGLMLDTLAEMHHRLHIEGSFMHSSDAEQAAERDWPVP